MWERELAAAKLAAVEAGKAIMEVYAAPGDWDVTYKDGNMPLTKADKRANRIIVERLKKKFPDYSILSEEEKDDKKRLENSYCFIVDPLDGTKEFLKRNGQFTVNIALAYEHRSIMGVIYVPAADELYYASEGAGAYLENDKAKQRLHVSGQTEEIRVVMSGSHSCPEMEQLLNKYQLKHFVRMGSSLKGCVIARGDAEIYYRFNPTMEWDTAAMQCIVEEAGGIFRQMDRSEMRYNRENSLNEKGFYIINRKENYLSL